MKYPTDIVTDAGWARVHQGHGLNRSTLLSDLIGSPPGVCGNHLEEEDLCVQEVYLRYQPRVVWCGRYGDACESEGEWHGHWYGLRPSNDPALRFTIVSAYKSTHEIHRTPDRGAR